MSREVKYYYRLCFNAFPHIDVSPGKHGLKHKMDIGLTWWRCNTYFDKYWILT